MAKQEDLDRAYMKCAFAISELSHANRKKVGAIIVSPNGYIIAEAFNGTPYKFDNSCEYPAECHIFENKTNWCMKCNKTLTTEERKKISCVQITKPEVVHAESNAILKVAKSTNSSLGATLYCTLSPCFECAKQIIQAGIKRVVYAEKYPYTGHSGPVRLMGLELLEQAKIQVDMLTL